MVLFAKFVLLLATMGQKFINLVSIEVNMRIVTNENLKSILFEKLDKKGQLSAGNELEVELISNGETISLRVCSYKTNSHGVEVGDSFQSLVDIRIDI